VSEATLELVGQAPSALGRLRLTTLPGDPDDLLVELAGDPARLSVEAPVQVREAAVYYFVVETAVDGPVRLEPAELFDRDNDLGRSGRFRPGEAVGHLDIEVFAGDQLLGSVTTEVRTAKLEHEEEYRQMLRDISEFAADAILQGFQPATESFQLDADVPVDLLYRRFAVLSARLGDPTFLSAVGQVLGRPHHDWRHETEWRSPGLPLSGGQELRRALATGRPRTNWPHAPSGSPLRTLPRLVEIRRHEESADTLPNRLVKFAFEDWRNVASTTQEAVRRSLSGSPQQRALRATAAALERLDDWLSTPLLREVGRLTTFPQGNQVLLKREGYRQIFAAWILSSSGVDVAVDLDDPLRISQRNVATLYEYWCYLQLVSIVANVCGKPTRLHSLFRSTSGGMALGLRQGRESKVSWSTMVAGRELQLELFFNRHFGATSHPGSGSWSRAMRPDCSLWIRPASALPGDDPDRLETWLHFDAKYRVDFLIQQFRRDATEAESVASTEEEEETWGESKRADVLKMHAYRDAIRRSAGAYVLFPGTETGRFTLDTETLPGIGAFPMRPSSGGGAPRGQSGLTDFLRDVLSHIANQATRHERSRFWSERIATEGNLERSPDPPMEALELPPADTDVLLVRIERNTDLDWIMKSRTCVLSGEAPVASRRVEAALGAKLLLFHGPGVAHQMLVRRIGEWFPRDAADLEGAGVPGPFVRTALCCDIAAIEDAPWWITEADLKSLVRDAPGRQLVTWLELAGAVRPA
jgi:hypothetical protein